MTQEDKELLLRDLSGRLPYRVFCNIGLDYPLPLQSLSVDKLDGILLDFYKDGKDYQVYLSEVKPYLFPFSSMTEEEQRTLDSMCNGVEMVSRLSGLKMFDKAFNWLKENHFDYRGLIEKGLAIDATGKNIY